MEGEREKQILFKGYISHALNKPLGVNSQKPLETIQAREDEMRSQRRQIALQLRDARRSDRIAFLQRQFSSGISTFDWEPEDYEWRPTFLPTMKRRDESLSADAKKAVQVG